MTKRVQIVGHVAGTAATFIGREREVTVDTDNDNLHLHNGALPGGEIIPNKTYVDARDTAIEVKADQGVTDSATAQAAADAAQATADDAIPDAVFSAAEQVIVSTGASTPAALAMAASTILARLASGSIKAATPAELRTLLALVIGADVQAWDAQLDDIAGLAPTNNNFIVGTGVAWALETPAQARASLDVAALADIHKYAIATGTKAIFFQASAPLGWTQDVTQNDKVLRVVSGSGGGAAGSWTITGVTVDGHVLTVPELASHDHDFTKETLATVVTGGGGAFVATVATIGQPDTLTTQTKGDGDPHTHGLTSDGVWRPAYIDVIVCTKDSP